MRGPTFARTTQGLPFSHIGEAYEDALNEFTPEELAEFAKNDRFFLLTCILNRPDMFHPWLYERCREVERDPHDWLDLWARWHYKSTIITFGGVIQELLNNPEITICIFSNTGKLARPFLRQIMTELASNEKLKALYPEILYEKPENESPKWSERDGLVVKRHGNPREATVEAHGLMELPTGKHYELRVYDDIVDTTSVTTPDQIQKTTEQWEISRNLRSRHGNREWYVGTRYAFGDTYQTMLDRGYRSRVHAATDDGTLDGKTVFMEEAEWKNLKDTSSIYTVACQQLLNPLEGSKQNFSMEWWNEYEIRPYTVNVYITVDPASSKKKGSDRTAIAVTAVDYALNKYLVDGMCHRMTLSERWHAIRYLREKWLRQPGVQMVKIGYERYGMQSDLEHFTERMRIEHQFFRIYELAWTREGGQSKQDRVQRCEPDFRNGKFHMPYRGSETAVMKRSDSRLRARPIRYKNEEGRIYDVVEWFQRNEYLFFPAVHVDFFDAISRIYDMEPVPPVLQSTTILPQVEASY